MQNLVELDKSHPAIAIVTLNRPDKRNALNIPLLQEFTEALDRLHKDPSIRVLILLGAGPSFCAGLDLAEAANPARADQSAGLVAKALESLYSSRLITIAAIQGAALAGGAGLVAACDFAIADEMAKFGFPEVKRGLVAAQVATLLKRQLSYRVIKELLLFGQQIDARQAKEIGLINRVVPEPLLKEEALHFAKLATKGAPEAQWQTKKLLDELDARGFHEDLRIAMQYHHQARHSHEALEGIAAFIEKREPLWTKTH